MKNDIYMSFFIKIILFKSSFISVSLMIDCAKVRYFQFLIIIFNFLITTSFLLAKLLLAKINKSLVYF